MIASGGPRPDAPGTLTQLFFTAIEKYDRADAMLFKAGGEWRPISHRELLTRVRNLARGLQTLGVAAGDRVAILSENRPEWAIADYACLTTRVADVPLYPNLPPDQIAYILNDAGAVAVFVSNAALAAKIAEARRTVPSLKTVIGFERGLAGADITLAELEAKGAAGAPADFAATHRADAQEDEAGRPRDADLHLGHDG